MRQLTIAGSLLLAAALAGCASSDHEQLEANKRLVRQFTAALNAADWDALDTLLSQNFRRHSQATTEMPEASGEEYLQLQQVYLASFPDQQVTVEMLVAEGDKVAAYATYAGTNTGPLGDVPATGRSVQLEFLSIFRIEGGKIAELWVEWDNVAMLTQLGLFPPPPPPPRRGAIGADTAIEAPASSTAAESGQPLPPALVAADMVVRGVTPDMDSTDAVAPLGQSDSVLILEARDGREGRDIFYGGLYVRMASGRVIGLGVTSAPDTTARGIGVGSSSGEVRAAYGPPGMVSRGEWTYTYPGADSGGLIFLVRDGQVTEIYIGRDRFGEYLY